LAHYLLDPKAISYLLIDLDGRSLVFAIQTVVSIAAMNT
jgi:hypothetical protein